MGLDVQFYEKAIAVQHSEAYPFDEQCWDSHVVTWVGDFPDQADGILNKACFVTEGDDQHVRHSYGGYNQYRAWLCMAMYGVEPEVIWTNPKDYRGRPFYEQINFADNEGTIGPVTAAKLAADYAEQREFIVGYWHAMSKPFDVAQHDHDGVIQRMTDKYDEWAAGFAIAADTGLVQFR